MSFIRKYSQKIAIIDIVLSQLILHLSNRILFRQLMAFSKSTIRNNAQSSLAFVAEGTSAEQAAEGLQ
jgi:hypothetical protein